jgi:hypothetical protein
VLTDWYVSEYSSGARLRASGKVGEGVEMVGYQGGRCGLYEIKI